MTTALVPTNVTLRDIGYRVSVHEDIIVFRETGGVAGCWTRMAFERKCGCWYLRQDSSEGSVMVSHVIAAMQLIEEWFGGNHDFKKGEHCL